MPAVYRYAGPDGEGIGALPEGVGAAVGSEYCVHLLPAPEVLAGLAAEASARGVPLLLLTPYFRDAELKSAMALFRALPPDAEVEAAVNDWGLLLALHALFPRVRLSIGRLLCGQKRCPRIGNSPFLTEEGRRWHGEGLFSSPVARRFLEAEFGVRGYHVDDLAWMPATAGGDPAASGGDPPRLFVHSPYSVVTVTDRCPWIGGVSSASIPRCSRPCLGGTVALFEPSMGKEMIQRGKARFVRFDPPGSGEAGPGGGPARVLYTDVP